MKKTGAFFIVLVTAPNANVARRLARGALRLRLAACASLIPCIESHYWWRGKLEKSTEVLIVFKTSARHLPALEALVVKEHPYDTPEFVAMELAGGNKRYLEWLARETGQ